MVQLGRTIFNQALVKMAVHTFCMHKFYFSFVSNKGAMYCLQICSSFLRLCDLFGTQKITSFIVDTINVCDKPYAARTS